MTRRSPLAAPRGGTPTLATLHQLAAALADTGRELVANRSRIALVAVGMAWGTFSLTLLLGAGGAMQTASAGTIVAGGADWIRLGGGATSLPFAGLPAGRTIRLAADDHQRLAAAIPELRATAAEYAATGVGARGDAGSRASVRVHGVTGDWCRLRGFLPAAGDGRPLSAVDDAERRAVAMVGRDVAAQLFGDGPVVGRTLWLGERPFRVVGRRDDRPPLTSYDGRDRDKVMIPATVFREIFDRRHPGRIVLGVRDPTTAARAIDRTYAVLGARHGFSPADRDALAVFDKTALDATVRGLIGGTRWLTVAVGVLGFLAAAVGVANVAWALADERADEFALQAALGATPRQLLSGRLLESVVVTLLGGGLGLAATAAVFAAIATLPLDAEVRAWLGHPAVDAHTATWVLAGLGAAGLIAGLAPARRAARSDPAVLLRDA